MNKSDLPYVILTGVFGLAIFVAGRMSAPEVVRTSEPIPQAAPSIVVIATKAEPPMALLPEVHEEQEVHEERTEPAEATTKPVAKKPVLVASTVSKPVETSFVKPEPIILEETPDLPTNPYRSMNERAGK